MASVLDDSDKHALLSIIFKELAGKVRSPVYEYLKNGISSPRTDLMSALACAVQINDEHEFPATSGQADKCELLLNSSDDDFYQVFRFRKQTIKDLIELMESRLLPSEEADGTPISVAKKVLMTCWLLTSAEEYTVASDVFHMNEELVLFVFLEICAELTKLTAQFVKWPSETEQESVIDAFEMQYGFPGVVGVVGSTAFNIHPPSCGRNTNRCYNPASDQHSIVIQAICDHQMIFRDICAGIPSHRTPSEILRDSPVYSSLVSRTDPLLKPQTFILGSHEYPQLANLLTPYSPEARGRPLDKTESNFNKQHASVELLIHKCFDVFRTRFLKLNYINVPDTSKATHIVLAACVLHNFAIIRGDTVS